MGIFSGFTSKTSEKLLLDAGAFFVNFDAATDTYDSAVTANKLLGATRGGGEFAATPEIRSIEIDGVKGAAKGLQAIDAWEVKLTANVLEITPDILKKSLTSASIDTETNTNYDIIKANNSIALADYIDNVTFVGKISGSQKPVIVQIYNALNVNGLTLTTADKGEAVIALELKGHYDPTTLDTPPFAIYYPKSATPAQED